jgi:hypothetical protein
MGWFPPTDLQIRVKKFFFWTHDVERFVRFRRRSPKDFPRHGRRVRVDGAGISSSAMFRNVLAHRRPDRAPRPISFLPADVATRRRKVPNDDVATDHAWTLSPGTSAIMFLPSLTVRQNKPQFFFIVKLSVYSN